MFSAETDQTPWAKAAMKPCSNGDSSNQGVSTCFSKQRTASGLHSVPFTAYDDTCAFVKCSDALYTQDAQILQLWVCQVLRCATHTRRSNLAGLGLSNADVLHTQDAQSNVSVL